MSTAPTLLPRLAAAFLALLLAVAVIPMTAAPADAARSRTTEEAKAEARFFGLHNRARTDPASFGLGQDAPKDGLLWNEGLADLARDWSDTMAALGDLPASNLGYAENRIAAWIGGSSLEMAIDELMESWMGSADTRANILAPQTEIGIGATIDDFGNIWVTALFDSPAQPEGTESYPGSSDVLSASPCSGQAHPLVGDWDGSGLDGIGWWCDGRTRLVAASGEVHEFTYGRAGDVPVVADWNGNGRDTVSVIRDRTWHLNDGLRGGAARDSFIYGRVTRGDVPIAGDWNRGGRDLPGVIRDREWHLRARQAGGAADWGFVYGRLTAGDLPLWGDWNGDGRDTAGIVRERTWHLRNRHAGGDSDISYVYGRVTAGDLPVVGDWTGDGRDTPAIVRGGVWHVKGTHGGGPADWALVFPRP